MVVILPMTGVIGTRFRTCYTLFREFKPKKIKINRLEPQGRKGRKEGKNHFKLKTRVLLPFAFLAPSR